MSGQSKQNALVGLRFFTNPESDAFANLYIRIPEWCLNLDHNRCPLCSSGLWRPRVLYVVSLKLSRKFSSSCCGSCASINVDGFTSPSVSIAITRNHGLEWLAICMHQASHLKRLQHKPGRKNKGTLAGPQEVMIQTTTDIFTAVRTWISEHSWRLPLIFAPIPALRGIRSS